LMEEPEIAQFLKVRLIGKTDFSALESARKAGLEKYLEKVPYMPHGEIITFLMRSPILLLPLNDTPNTLGIIPGKLFEYLAAGRPIFCIGHPKGDSARIIQDCEAGMVFGFHEKDKMKEGILALFREFRSGNFQVKGKEIMNYSRQKGAEKFASLLNHLTYSG
jgi:glycosyltransferase involved in cell wall biosynthesis